MDTKVTLPFADGEYSFWLPMPRLIAAEREMGRADSEGVRQPRSIFALFYELGAHLGEIGGETVLAGPSPALLIDAHAIIRNALIGGDSGLIEGETVALSDALAKELVKVYCFPARPAILDLGLSWRILQASIYGVASGSKKKDGADGAPQPS